MDEFSVPLTFDHLSTHFIPGFVLVFFLWWRYELSHPGMFCFLNKRQDAASTEDVKGLIILPAGTGEIGATGVSERWRNVSFPALLIASLVVGIILSFIRSGFYNQFIKLNVLFESDSLNTWKDYKIIKDQWAVGGY